MGMSIAQAEPYFIYVLRLEQGRWYVGSTKNLARRMRSHFSRGGATATRECPPVSIEAIYRLIDYQIRTDCAHERAEVMVATRIAEQYGYSNVRGAKHGKGWGDAASPNNLRDIARYSRFALTDEGQQLMASLVPILLSDALDERTCRLLDQYRSRRMTVMPNH